MPPTWTRSLTMSAAAQASSGSPTPNAFVVGDDRGPRHAQHLLRTHPRQCVAVRTRKQGTRSQPLHSPRATNPRGFCDAIADGHLAEVAEREGVSDLLDEIAAADGFHAAIVATSKRIRDALSINKCRDAVARPCPIRARYTGQCRPTGDDRGCCAEHYVPYDLRGRPVSRPIQCDSQADSSGSRTPHRNQDRARVTRRIQRRQASAHRDLAWKSGPEVRAISYR